jgi:hypothetical protein
MSGKRKGKETTHEKPKKPRFYVHDGVAEHEIRRASYPCVILDPDNVAHHIGNLDPDNVAQHIGKLDLDNVAHHIGKLEPVINELQARLTIQTSEHISSLTVRVVSEYENSAGEKKNYSAMLRLNANAVGKMQLIAFADEQLALITWLKSKQEGDSFYILVVTEISSTLICSERLFCDNVDAPRI